MCALFDGRDFVVSNLSFDNNISVQLSYPYNGLICSVAVKKSYFRIVNASIAPLESNYTRCLVGVSNYAFVHQENVQCKPQTVVDVT